MFVAAARFLEIPVVVQMLDGIRAHPDCAVMWLLAALYGLAVLLVNRHALMRWVYLAMAAAHAVAARLQAGMVQGAFFAWRRPHPNLGLLRSPSPQGWERGTRLNG
ncbi:MAG: hypothetical protein NT133_04915 [Alphaproteobacteria bacterium]|nr:hypothetical protein [Alphaproteobacteria bacterium]